MGGKEKREERITTIQEWVTCFNTYIASVLMREPDRASDLLACSSLIVKASSDYEGDPWLSYDRFFRRQAAAEPSLPGVQEVELGKPDL